MPTARPPHDLQALLDRRPRAAATFKAMPGDRKARFFAYLREAPNPSERARRLLREVESLAAGSWALGGMPAQRELDVG